MRVFLLLFFLLPMAAYAAETVTVDTALCRALTKHVPDASVEYQPGVDVDGNKVEPADLPGGAPPVKIPERIEFPLTVSLAKQLNLNPNQPPLSQLGTGTEAVIGVLAVEGNRATFNGKPLDSAQQDNLAVLCLEKDKR